jgi:hypothetical protein
VRRAMSVEVLAYDIAFFEILKTIILTNFLTILYFDSRVNE